MTRSALRNDLADAVRRETAGEIIRWTGQPDARRVFWLGSIIWLFAVPWTAFSFYMTSIIIAVVLSRKQPVQGAWGYTGGFVAVIFMIPFVVGGIAMLAAPYYASRKARASVFVVTDRKLLSIEVRGALSKVRTILPESILKLERTERRDGSGTLDLLIGHRKDGDGGTVGETETITGVADVRRLEQLLIAMRAAPRSA